MSPEDSRGGPLTTDRPTAENPDQELASDGTPHDRQQRQSSGSQASGELCTVAADLRRERDRPKPVLGGGRLTVPAVDQNAATLTAALAYADAGWYVLPVSARDKKNPGSRVGKGWPA